MASLTPPSGRCWWGMYQPPSGTGDPASNTWLDRRMDVVKHYHDWSNTGNNGAFPTATEQAQAAAGYIVHIAWNHGTTYSSSLPDYTWADIAAGTLDAVIDARAAAVASWGAVCWIDFGHEPEFYGSPNSTPADYVVAYQRIHDRFVAAGATNVVWAWVVASGTRAASVYQQYYPGDAYVDWIGFDPYNWADSTWEISAYDKWVTPYNNFKNGALDGAPTGGTGAKSKPFMLGEWGSEWDSTHDRTGFLTSVPDAIRALPGIKAVTYFNNGFGTHPSVILSDAPSQAAFNTAGQDALFNDLPPGAGFRAAAVNQAGSTGPNVTIPASVVAGDGMLLALHWNHQNGTDTISSTPAGWTQVGTEQLVTFNGTYTASRLYKRVAQAGDASSSVSFTKALASRWALQVLAYSGTHATDPVAGVNVASLAATSPTLSTPGVDLSSPAWVVSLVGGRNSTQTAWSTQPTGTEISYPSGTITPVAGNVTALGADSGGLVGAGTAAGRQSATADTSFSSGVMWSVALAPAANAVPDKTGAGVSQGVAAGAKAIGTTAAGVGTPTIIVQVAFGGSTTIDPQAGYLQLDVGPPLGVGQLGDVDWVDVAAGKDVISFSRRMGQASEIDPAQPATATIVLDGTSGDYDPTNLAGPYVANQATIYTGVHTQNDLSSLATITDFETAAQKAVSIVHFFSSWGSTDGSQSFNATQMTAIRDHGSIPMVTWEPWDPTGTETQPAYQLADIIAGTYDTYMTTWLNAAKTWGHPFFLRFAHEMNGNWYPWSEQVNGNSAGEYVQAWQHVWDLAVSLGVTNITWVWCPTRIFIGDTTQLGPLYPGNAYVDWVGWDAYNRGTADGGSWHSFQERSQTTYDTLVGLTTKPMMVAETGCVEQGGDKAAWFTEALGTTVPNLMPQVRAWVYFDKLKTYDYRITTSTAAQVAYAAAVSKPLYAANTFDTISTTPIGVQGTPASQVDAGQPVWVKAVWQGQVYSRFRGFIDDIDYDFGLSPTVTLLCSDGLTILGGAELDAGAAAYDGDRTGTRIGRILDTADWPTSLRALDAGYSLCQATGFGDTALALLEEVVGTELGIHFCDEAGAYTFYDRWHTWRSPRSQTPQALLSDSGTDVDMASLRVTKGKSTTYNQARITRNDGTEQVADNLASQATYGTRTYPGSVGALLRADTDALNMGQWLVTRYGSSDLKATEVRVEAGAQGMWSVLLPLTIYDLLTATRDYGPNTVSVDVLIVGIGEEIDDSGRWDLTFATAQPNRVVPFLLDASRLDIGQVTF